MTAPKGSSGRGVFDRVGRALAVAIAAGLLAKALGLEATAAVRAFWAVTGLIFGAVV